MLPTKKMLKSARAVAQQVSRQPKEIKGNFHYGIFLLCFGAGLRVSEAISFDCQKQVSGLYVVQSKNHQTRKVAVSEKIVEELKINNFAPNQTNRFNFANYCKRVKKEANLPKEVELTPHTGRRAWATYQAESGVPLTILSKMLGHKNLETTAQYYWKDTSHLTLEQNILYGQSLTKRVNILDSVKDKKYWREYNAKRKEYLSKKSKEYYELTKSANEISDSKAKKSSRSNEVGDSKENKTNDSQLNNANQQSKITINPTIYAQQLTHPKSTSPPKSLLEISK